MLRKVCAASSQPALLFADVADNPGGGARGNTTDILRCFLAAGVDRTAFAIHFDPELATEAHAKGKGGRFHARLNRAEKQPDSRPLEAEAEVMALSDGQVTGRRGLLADRILDCGKTAWLRLEGRIDVVFVSVRHQCMEPAMLEHLGIDLTALRGLVLKSRGHFRAGFDDLFADAQIIEVDGPGLVRCRDRSGLWTQTSHGKFRTRLRWHSKHCLARKVLIKVFGATRKGAYGQRECACWPSLGGSVTGPGTGMLQRRANAAKRPALW